MNKNEISELLRKAVNVLFISNPQGTSLGVLIGIICDGLLGFFSPVIKTVEFIDITAIKIWHLTSIGVFSMNMPYFLKRNKVDPSILEAISYIEEQKSRGNISQWQINQMYENLHDKVLSEVMRSSSTSGTAQALNDILSASTKVEE